MITPGVDEFGLSRSERIAMADAELAAARAIGDQWRYPGGFPTPGMHSEYRCALRSAADLYYVEGLRLLSRRVTQLASGPDVPRAWETFDRLNGKAT